MSEYQEVRRSDIKHMHKDLQAVVMDAVMNHGALGKRTSKGHLMLKFPNGKTVLIGGTPSDHRSAKNSAADVRRAMRTD